MKFFAFAASHRTDSLNRKLVTQAASMLRNAGHDVTEEPYGTMDMPLYNDEICTQELVHSTANLFAQRTGEADGIIVSSPEYNWSYPGSLKNILDWTSRLAPCPLAGKTILLMSATPAGRGGLNGMMHLRAPFEALQSFVFPRVFPLGGANHLLADGALKDERQLHILTHILLDYTVYTEKLRSK